MTEPAGPGPASGDPGAAADGRTMRRGDSAAGAGRLSLERRIEAPAETVFAYFTDPQRFARWLGVESRLDPRPGGAYELRVPQGLVARGHFTELVPCSRIVFTWGWVGHPDVPPGSSRVEVTLRPDGDATIVRLVHDGLPDQAAAQQHTQGWERYLDRLVVAGAGGDPGPDVA